MNRIRRILSLNSRAEGIALGISIVIVVVIITVPWITGAIQRPADAFYTGLLGPYGNDQAFYLGWGARQAENGQLLFEDKYNGVVSRRAVFNPLWLTMGWSARITGLSVQVIYHIQRVLCSVFLMLILYAFIGRFITEPTVKICTLLTISLASGLGVFLQQAGVHTPDMWVVESNLFLIMLWELVLPCAAALFLLSLLLGYHTFFVNSRYAWWTGIAILLLGAVYPYAVVSVYNILAVTAIYSIVRVRAWRRHLGALAKIVIVSLPVVLYDYHLVSTRPELVAGQGLYASPNLVHYILGFGVISLLALEGIVRYGLRGRREYHFLVIWTVVTFVQIYIPISLIPFQLQLILGAGVPLGILAMIALTGDGDGWLVHAMRYRSRFRLLAIMFVCFLAAAALATSFQHYRNLFFHMQDRDLPEYMDTAVKSGIDWLEANTEAEDVVLASTRIAPYIPVFGHNRVFCSDYGAPTAEFTRKSQQIHWLFGASIEKTNREISEFIEANRIDYLFYDRYIPGHGPETVEGLASHPDLRLAFANAGVTIFKVEGSVK